MAEKNKVMDSSAVNQQTQFVFDLLAQLYKADHNLVLSPYSAIATFCMVLSGADGETKKQMMKTLFGVSVLDKGDSHLEQFILRNQSVMKNNADSLLISNAMYVDQIYPLYKDYLDILITKFNSNTKTLDFINDPSGAVKVINSDAEKATKGLISQVVTAADIDPLTRLFLMNAIYFKGIWKSQSMVDLFYVSKNQPFRTTSGQLLHTSFFYHTDSFPYYHNRDWHIKALRLDYQPSASGGKTAMVFLMPDKEDISIQTFIQSQLTPAKFDHILHNLEPISGKYNLVKFKIPRFKFTNSLSLAQPMTNLGMTDLFKLDTANLHKMSSSASVKGLSVGDCLQKVVIDVNERGTEAAALTFGELTAGGTSGMKHFIANRPFVFVLIALDVQIEVLFVGVVEDPTKDE